MNGVGAPKMKSIIALIFIATVALATPAAFATKAHSGEPPEINRFNGLWDSYGGISCRRGAVGVMLNRRC
jgi:hypothetical protein